MSQHDLDPLLLRKNVARRAILGSGVGLGAVALAECLAGGSKAASTGAMVSGPAPDLGALTTGQFPAKAKRVVSIHMWGAMSHVDTFDYKPELIKRHGQEIPPSIKNNGQRISAMSNGQTAYPLVKPLWPYKQYGQTGTWASDLVQHIGGIADDLTFIYTMNTPHVNHDPAAIFLYTGFQLAGRPSTGAWVNYALGTDNSNLPAFVVLKSQKSPAGVGANSAAWGSGFLPSHHQGVEFRAGQDPVLYIGSPDGIPKARRREELDALGELSREQYAQTGDPEILSKIAQYEMAFRMQDSVPEIADISDEPDYVLNMYGPDVHTPGSFARNALLTRRLIERGVKFVELTHVGWDHHSRIYERHPVDTQAIDQPSAALVADLKQRGLLEDTLVVFGGEFGRTSYAQGAGINDLTGRDHHGACFTYWMAGGGVKAGYHHGETDPFSYNIVRDPVTVHDLHATMLHLLGIDHQQLTFAYLGRDYRLTDVYGQVVKEVIA